MAIVQYTFTHNQYIEQHNRHKQYIEQYSSLIRKSADNTTQYNTIQYLLVNTEPVFSSRSLPQFLWNITVVVYVTLLAKVKFFIYFASVFGDSFRSFSYIVMVFVSHSRLIHWETFNPLNAELNPICHLLALLGVHHFLHVSRIKVKSLTLKLLMSYIYIYIYIYIYMEHLFLIFLDHTLQRSPTDCGASLCVIQKHQE